jgi:signal peptidase II
VKKSTAVLLTIFSIVLIDQIVKIYIKTHINYGDGFDMFGLSWAKIHFVENEGMAFGMSFGGLTGKYILSIFRIIMTVFLLYILKNLIKQGETLGLIVSFSMVIAGAIGNSIDGMFYGLVFSESHYHGGLATMFPAEGGYGSFLTGKVVDMLYFPLIDTVLPEWVPVWGGERFEFFRPVFNIADSAITVGVASILLFHRRFFNSDVKSKVEENNVNDADEES